MHWGLSNESWQEALAEYCLGTSYQTADGQYTGGVFCLIDVARVAPRGLGTIAPRDRGEDDSRGAEDRRESSSCRATRVQVAAELRRVERRPERRVAEDERLVGPVPGRPPLLLERAEHVARPLQVEYPPRCLALRCRHLVPYPGAPDVQPRRLVLGAEGRHVPVGEGEDLAATVKVNAGESREEALLESLRHEGT